MGGVKFNKIYEIISHIILASFMVFFLFFNSDTFIPRLWYSLKNLFLNIIYYFAVILGFDFDGFIGFVPEEILDIYGGFDNLAILPINLDTFFFEIKCFFKMLINGETYVNFFIYALPTLAIILRFVLLFIMILAVFLLSADTIFEPNDKQKNENSKPLIIYLKFKKKIIDPLVYYIKDFVSYNLYYYRIHYFVLLILFCCSIGLIQVIIDVISFLFYFCASYDFKGIFNLVCINLIDLGPFLVKIPLIIYLLVIYIIIDKIRLNKATERLYHMENYNKGFIKSLGAYTFLTGTPGSGKTMLMSDMSTSCEEILRTDLFSIISEIQFMYPHFPFLELENKIDNAVKKGILHNHFQSMSFMKRELEKFFETNDFNDFFGYDLDNNHFEYNNGLFVESIFEALIDYAGAYYLYSMNCSLVSSNYSIRSNGEIIDNGFHKRWQYDFFSYDPYTIDYSNNSKIVDFNCLRLQKKLEPYKSIDLYLNKDLDKNGFVFESCILAFQEISNERKNQNFTKRISKDDTSTHQLNDGFNNLMKIKRHDSTIRNRLMFKCFMDGQRAEDLNAELRELNEYIITIHHDKSEWETSLPLWYFEPMICESIIGFCENFHFRFRENRGDNTLLSYLIDLIGYKISNYYIKRKNNFDYKKMELEVNSSITQEFQNYFLMKKKAYARRYSTDTFSNFFRVKYEENSSFGYKDLPAYKNYKSTDEELKSSNSYFVNEINSYTSFTYDDVDEDDVSYD